MVEPDLYLQLANLLGAEVEAYKVPLGCFLLFHPGRGSTFSLRTHSGWFEVVYQSSFSGGSGAGGSAWVETSCEAGCTPADTAGAATSNSAGAATRRLRGPASRVLSWYSSVRQAALNWSTVAETPSGHTRSAAVCSLKLLLICIRQVRTRQKGTSCCG